MVSTGMQGTNGEEFLPLSTGIAQPVVPEATTWGSRSGRGVSAVAVSIAMLMAAAVAVVATLQLARAPATPSRAAAHPRELHELAAATLRRFSKVRRLQPTKSAEALPNPILKYQSVDEHGEPGVFLGNMDEAGDIVAQNVELNTTQPTKMTFIVGPEVEGVGALVRGSLKVRDDCAYGFCGTIRAGFVNMRSTLSGTWQTEGKNLDSVIHIRWIEPEMHIDQKLTWDPADTTDDAQDDDVQVQDAQNPSENECERQHDENSCSHHKPTDSSCFCSWGGDIGEGLCVMVCA